MYQILMDKSKNGTATVTITDNMMDGYGITLDELHNRAIQNMDALQPYCFKGMNEVMAETYAESIAWENQISMEEAKEMALQMMLDIPNAMYVLTNETKVNGANTILNDEIRQAIAKQVGDFYVLPSSLHETLIVPKSIGMKRKDLEQMVQEVNQTQVAPEERLSDHVYEYDAKTHELFRSDKVAERARQKAAKQAKRVSVKQKLAEKRSVVVIANSSKENTVPGKKIEAAL